jgi:hypothetical protein
LDATGNSVRLRKLLYCIYEVDGGVVKISRLSVIVVASKEVEGRTDRYGTYYLLFSDEGVQETVPFLSYSSCPCLVPSHVDIMGLLFGEAAIHQLTKSAKHERGQSCTKKLVS